MTESLYKNLENEFFEDLKSTQRVILCIGQKGSGKTTLLNTYLKYSLVNKLYDAYHLVLPSYKFEMNDSYGYLKNQFHCNIYPKYTESVSERVIKDRAGGKKILFMVDDGSGFCMDDDNFKTIITTSRHGKSKTQKNGGICVFLCLHSAKRVMLPIVRQNCDYIFIFKMNNRKLLENLYEEYFGMIFDRFKEFIEMYNEVMAEKYNSILYSNQSSSIDPFVVSWEVIKQMENVTVLEQTGSKTQKTKSEPKEVQKPSALKNAFEQTQKYVRHEYKKRIF